MNEKNKLVSSFLIKNTPDQQSQLNKNSDLKLDAHRARLDEIKKIMEDKVSDMKDLSTNLTNISNNLKELERQKIEIENENENLKMLKEMSAKWISDPETLDDALIHFMNKTMSEKEYSAIARSIEVIPIINKRYRELLRVKYVIGAYARRALEISNKAAKMVEKDKKTSNKNSHFRRNVLWGGWMVSALLIAFIILS
tara:strand:- start:24 stop:617 length:594 start_codon:yes stop_codon:yes gene_type:complete